MIDADDLDDIDQSDTSPSRAFADLQWDHIKFDGSPWPPPMPAPWSAACGTSQCDGLCLPQCDWCLVSHSCPEDCLGGSCPYESLDPSMVGERDRGLGHADAVGGAKRRRLTQGVVRRHYLRGFESWIRRKDPRRRAKEAASSRLAARSWGDCF